MTSRSIRNKLRFQVTGLIGHLNHCQSHLKFIDDLAEGKSDYINQYVPTLTALIEEMIKTADSFRQGL